MSTRSRKVINQRKICTFRPSASRTCGRVRSNNNLVCNSSCDISRISCRSRTCIYGGLVFSGRSSNPRKLHHRDLASDRGIVGNRYGKRTAPRILKIENFLSASSNCLSSTRNAMRSVNIIRAGSCRVSVWTLGNNNDKASSRYIRVKRKNVSSRCDRDRYVFALDKCYRHSLSFAKALSSHPGTGANFSRSHDTGCICFSHLPDQNKSLTLSFVLCVSLPEFGQGKLKSPPCVLNI